MTITREQVADLQPGDVVELVHEDWPVGTVVRGPLYPRGDAICVGAFVVRWNSGVPGGSAFSLTVVTRDVASELAELAEDLCQVANDIFDDDLAERVIHLAAQVRGRGRLLVDGETGQVVP